MNQAQGLQFLWSPPILSSGSDCARCVKRSLEKILGESEEGATLSRPTSRNVALAIAECNLSWEYCFESTVSEKRTH